VSRELPRLGGSRFAFLATGSARPAYPRRPAKTKILLVHNQHFCIYRNMETKQALDAFSALSQETRLGVLRHLIRALPGSVAAGDLARDLDVPASTMSTHLAILNRAGLVTSERSGRVISYQADMDGLRELLGFLVNDCCQGKPELCGDLMKAMTPVCCP